MPGTIYGVDGTRNNGIYSKDQTYGNLVKSILTFVDDNSSQENTGIPVYVDPKKTIKIEDTKANPLKPNKLPEIIQQIRNQSTFIREYVITGINNLQNALRPDSGRNSKYDLSKVKQLLQSKGLTLEQLSFLGEKGLEGDALIEAALRQAGCSDSEICSALTTEEQKKIAVAPAPAGPKAPTAKPATGNLPALPAGYKAMRSSDGNLYASWEDKDGDGKIDLAERESSVLYARNTSQGNWVKIGKLSNNYYNLLDKGSKARSTTGNGEVDQAELNTAEGVIKFWAERRLQKNSDLAVELNSADDYEDVRKSEVDSALKTFGGWFPAGFDFSQKGSLEEALKKNNVDPALSGAIMRLYEERQGKINANDVAVRIINCALASRYSDQAMLKKYGIEPGKLAHSYTPKEVTGNNLVKWAQGEDVSESEGGSGGGDDQDKIKKAEEKVKANPAEAARLADGIKNTQAADQIRSQVIEAYLAKDPPDFDGAIALVKKMVPGENRSRSLDKITTLLIGAGQFQPACDVINELTPAAEKRQAMGKLVFQILEKRQENSGNELVKKIMDDKELWKEANDQFTIHTGENGAITLAKLKEKVSTELWIDARLWRLNHDYIADSQPGQPHVPGEAWKLISGKEPKEAAAQLDKIIAEPKSTNEQKAYAYFVRGRLLYALARNDQEVTINGTVYNKRQLHLESMFSLKMAWDESEKIAASRKSEFRGSVFEAMINIGDGIKFGPDTKWPTAKQAGHVDDYKKCTVSKDEFIKDIGSFVPEDTSVTKTASGGENKQPHPVTPNQYRNSSHLSANKYKYQSIGLFSSGVTGAPASQPAPAAPKAGAVVSTPSNNKDLGSL